MIFLLRQNRQRPEFGLCNKQIRYRRPFGSDQRSRSVLLGSHVFRRLCGWILESQLRPVIHWAVVSQRIVTGLWVAGMCEAT